MKTLLDVYNYIKELREPTAFVAVDAAHWDSIRIECQQWCDDNDEPFSADPKLAAPNFLVAGVPVIEMGRA